ncbi:glycosyltransferase [Neisseria yangbaofengii]|uniref:glycosyltransferase n=1 Tax=Neisseria yangbaofengii TaxID=2709396 RepID=UPI001F14C820|nr:glycosyltransferase [Neisseria yangbaofengii]
MQRNQSNLARPFNIPPEKFDYTDNLQQPEQTRSLAAEPLLPEDEQYFQGTGKVFITIGRLSMEKDHAKLINSFAQIAADYPDSRLLIVGDGALRHALSQQIAELKLENQVHLLGLRSNPFPLLKKADCFVLSSNHEGQPMTLFEAMILEKMIIATDIVGSRGVLENRSGYLVENSVTGLAQGLGDFLAGKLPLTTYDIEDYQQKAINHFYHLIN